MRAVVAFVFGSGWWVLWHLLLLVWLLPLGWLLNYFQGFRPDGGPQGGEAVLVLLLLVLMALMLVSLVNVLLWASTLVNPGWPTYLKAAGWWAAGWVAMLLAVLFLVELATSLSASRAGRSAGVVGLGVVFGAFYGLNLLALWRRRRRSGVS